MKKIIFVFALLLWIFGGVSAKEQTAYHAYLPLIGNQKKTCGTEVWRNSIYTPQLDELGCRYVRYNAGTELAPGLYRTWFLNGTNWNSLTFFENDLATLRTQHTIPVVVFHGNAQGTCAPVPQGEYQAYADFITEAIMRYNLEYIEIWNEADALSGLPYLFGCWGSENLTSYMQFLTTITDTVWAIHPHVKVVTSLMTDAPASVPMLQALAENYSNEARFILGFHHYQPYNSAAGWGLSDKVKTIRGFWNGRLWLTETNMTKWSRTGVCVNPTQAFQEEQAAYIADVQAIAALDGYFMYGLFRYSSSWRCAALLLDNLEPNLAYQVIQSDAQPLELFPYP